MKRRLSIFICLQILCSPLLGQTLEIDIIKGDSVCTDVNTYKKDNIMIADLLNTTDMQIELLDVKQNQLNTCREQINTTGIILGHLADSLHLERGNVATLGLKLKKTRKIGVSVAIIAFLLGVVL